MHVRVPVCLTVCVYVYVCACLCICVSQGLMCVFVDAQSSAKLGVEGSALFSWIGSFVAQCLWESGAQARPGDPYSRFACSGHTVEKSGSV